MSEKINIKQIIVGHFSTLNNAKTNKTSISDISTFYVFPIFTSFLLAAIGIDISKEAISLIVTTGAILTGLLLNLLFLVYDQKSKLPEVNTKNSNWPSTQKRHSILEELYYNISYATIISLILVVISIIHILAFDVSFDINYKIQFQLDFTKYVTSPILFFFSLNLIMTILMVIKRIYRLLTTS